MGAFLSQSLTLSGIFFNDPQNSFHSGWPHASAFRDFSAAVARVVRDPFGAEGRAERGAHGGRVRFRRGAGP